jgi:hypothetical protein
MRRLSLTMLLTLCLSPACTFATPQAGESKAIQHVLLISVDGLHALDVQNYIQAHQDSTLAQLARHGIVYTHAHTVGPADSFPGLLALTTGGTPAVTGVYYDESYDRQLSPPGSDCRQHGTSVIYDESVDGPGARQGKPVLDPKRLPRDPEHCTPVYPHDYLRVNTVFEVVHQAGLHTAWIDKHPVYEILNGPSGKGVEDLYTPEIGDDYEGMKHKNGKGITGSIARTEHYDAKKVRALINEIDGKWHDGKSSAAVPSLFGLNLQAVNVGEKLAGYRNGQGQPTPQLEAAIAHCDKLIGEMVTALRKQKLLDTTLLIVTAKHGNGPIDPKELRRIDKKQLAQVINQAVPGAAAQITTDQGALIWLKDPSQTARVAAALEQHNTSLGIKRVLYGTRLALSFPAANTDSRTPDLIVIAQQGVIYAKASVKKKAEHGGFNSDDTHVALLVSNPYLPRKDIVQRAPVYTTQVAPTMLASLGLSPLLLQAVDKQGTPVLPGEKWGVLASKVAH